MAEGHRRAAARSTSTTTVGWTFAGHAVPLVEVRNVPRRIRPTRSSCMAARVKDGGAVRTQYAHIIDMVPTVLDCRHRGAATIRGVPHRRSRRGALRTRSTTRLRQRPSHAETSRWSATAPSTTTARAPRAGGRTIVRRGQAALRRGDPSRHHERARHLGLGASRPVEEGFAETKNVAADDRPPNRADRHWYVEAVGQRHAVDGMARPAAGGAAAARRPGRTATLTTPTPVVPVRRDARCSTGPQHHRDVVPARSRRRAASARRRARGDRPLPAAGRPAYVRRLTSP